MLIVWPTSATDWRGTLTTGASLGLSTLTTKRWASAATWLMSPSPSSCATMVMV